MAEDITFAAPVQVNPGVSRFRIASLFLDWIGARITITLREWTGSAFAAREVVAIYDGATATTLMIALNKANLTTRSLHERILDRLVADGKIPSGTVAGSVD